MSAVTLFSHKLVLEKEMTTHSSILAWKIQWTEEPGRLQSIGLPRAGHDWATELSSSHNCSLFYYCYGYLQNIAYNQTAILPIREKSYMYTINFEAMCYKVYKEPWKKEGDTNGILIHTKQINRSIQPADQYMRSNK